MPPDASAAASPPVRLSSARFSAWQDWLVAAAVAGLAGCLAATQPDDLLPLTLAPVGFLALCKYPILTLWVVSLEMALGGWGHAAEIGGMPIRHLLLAMLMGSWVTVKLLHLDFRLRGGIHAAAAALFLATVLFAVHVSLVNGNPAVWQDAATSLFLLLLLPFADVAARRGGPEMLLRMFVVCVFLLGVIQCVLTVAVFGGLISGDWLYVIFKERFGGVSPIGGPFWRVFMVGSIYFQVVILILAAGLLADRPLFGRRWDLTMLAALGPALLFTYTRGFWATTIIGFGILAWLTTDRGRLRWAATALAGVLVLLLLIPLANAGVVEVLNRRIARTFDPDHDVSVALRLDLYPRVLGRVMEKPVLGYGFGQPVENQLYYENSYLYYAVKVGMIGLIVLAIGWMLMLWDGVRLARHHPDPATRARAAGLTAAVVSMLIVTSINPFINSPVGFYFQALTAAILYGFGLRANGPDAAGSPDRPPGTLPYRPVLLP